MGRARRSDRASDESVAELTHTPSPTMTKLVDRMVKSGLVRRQTDPPDRRRILAFATARGRRRYERLQFIIDAAIADLIDDDQLRELVGELHRRMSSNPNAVTVTSDVV